MARNDNVIRARPAGGGPEKKSPSERPPSTGATAKVLWIAVALPGIVWLTPHLAPTENPLQWRSAGISLPTVGIPAQAGVQSEVPEPPKRADFAHERVSKAVRHIADWVVDSGDNLGMPFVIVDKKNAKVFVFGPNGRILGAAPALLGSARGDDSLPGIGDRETSNIRPEERTTPAGRFVAERGRNLHGEDIVWIDYEAAVSMHRVRVNNSDERRLERLASPTPEDNRISYGCINVPVQFYNTVISEAIAGNKAIVYVLPEIRSPHTVFGSYDVDERDRRHSAGVPARAHVAPAASPDAHP